MSYRVGLTGGIGSGKSTVAALFRERGATVIDSDAIAHELTAPKGAAIGAIKAAFGDAAIGADGALDRARMRRLIFGDPDAKRRLEGILHPMIREAMAVEARQARTPYALLVIPLLFEAPDFRARVDRALVVDCPEAVQIERTMRRSGLSLEETEAIMAQQMGRAERLRQADDVIQNDAGVEALAPQVERLHRLYLGFSGGSD